MAKLTLDLSRFRASGVYTVEFDQSESITVSTQTIRLVVGFSRRGPFNAPVFLRDVKSARQIFGEVDTILEKRGSFFHRAIETCLQTGPIFALNLLALNNTPTGDKIDYRPFSTSITQDNADTYRDLIASFYNKERFWFPDTSYFQAIVDNNPLTKNMLLSFTNFSQRPFSVIIRKAKDIKGFDITAREFYGAGNVPEYIKDFDYISDYFLDVIVVEGDWTNYETLSIDPLYSRFFDINGIKSGLVENFISDDTVTLIANMTGCIIPDFTDRNGVNHFIETIVNNTVGTTGIFCTVNRTMLDDYENSNWKLDLIGHTLIDSTKESMNFLSYVGPITDELFFSSNFSLLEETKTSTFNSSTDPASVPGPDFNEVNGKVQNIYVKSLPYTNNSSPFFNTLVIPRPKPVFPDQVFNLTEYAKLAGGFNSNSLVKAYGATVGLFGPGNSRLNYSGFLKVDSVTNTGASLELVLSNPEKNTEPAGVYGGATISGASVASDNSVSCNITFEETPAMTPAKFDVVYVRGLNKYFVVSDVISSILPPVVIEVATLPTAAELSEADNGKIFHETSTDSYFQFVWNLTGETIINEPTLPPIHLISPDKEGNVIFDESTETFWKFNLGLSGVIVVPDHTALSLDDTDDGSIYFDPTGYFQWDWNGGGGSEDWTPLFDSTVGQLIEQFNPFTWTPTTAPAAVDPIVQVRFYPTLAELKTDIEAETSEPITYVLPWFLQWLPDVMTGTPTDFNGRQAMYCNTETAIEYVPDFRDGAMGYSGIQYIFNPIYIGDNKQLEDLFIDAYPGSQLFAEIANRSIIDGDYASYDEDFTDFRYLSFNQEVGMYGLPVQRIRQWVDVDLREPIKAKLNSGGDPLNPADWNYALFIQMDPTGGSWTRSGVQTTSDPMNPHYAEMKEIAIARGLLVRDETDLESAPTYIAIQSAAEKIQQHIPIVVNTLSASKTVFRVDATNGKDIEVGQFLAVDIDMAGGQQRLTRVINKIKRANAETGFTEYEIQVNEPVAVSIKNIDGVNVQHVNRFLPIPQIAKTLQFTALSGFTITAYHMPGGREQLWKIYGVIEDTNLGATLIDKELISFRYIIDTFAGGLEPMMGPKAILSRLAKRRLKCMAILNAPSIAEFIASTDPRFTDEPRPDLGEPKPLLRTEYISTGGNLSLGPSFRFSLPDDENGARFCGVFSPFLQIYENSKNKMIPPAADVSNNFVRKFINGQPYAIAAGPRRGILSNPKLTGLEYEYLLTDREWIEPFGLNPIITTKKTGPMIYGNQTAYQRTLTAFNNLHVRDRLITIEETVEDILSNYIFEFNDASTRLEIRTIVDGYLQTVRNSGGIFDYMVIMDETNNTPEIIDQNIGIIDIGIEPARGLQKVINRVTVLKTGTISSGGFTVA